ncbi:ssl1498 family light-harvesting-like protein [Trichothermofontia sichuanensis B231]|uniref:photosystem II assembly protein Psb34 n=1 Tax=Trichothermofontia sichuanensis TaxID=3045816 RepID=UPI00224842D6|nr:ssl1498 family light-harvesting-like protein [Trichothermofontia sichuanensis B231]
MTATQGTSSMYTTDDRGVLNSYAMEPAMTYATYPSEAQQRQYALQGAVAMLFVSLLIGVAAAA